MKISFFQAVIGSCSGLKIFSALQEQKLWRAIVHLLLMTVIVSGIIMLGTYPDIKRVAMRSLDLLEEHCGGIRITPNRIEPLRSVDKSFQFVLAGPLTVTYLPELAASTRLPADLLPRTNMGVVWIPEKMVLYWPLPGERLGLLNLSDAVKPMSGMESIEIPRNELAKTVAPMAGWKLEDIEKEQTVSVADLRELISCGLLPVLWLVFFRQTILETIIYIAMFSIVFSLMNMRRPRRMKFKTLLVLAIYAGFPAMILGGMAGALKLPWLDFNLVYVLGMTLYLVLVINYLERERQFREWMRDNSPDEK